MRVNYLNCESVWKYITELQSFIEENFGNITQVTDILNEYLSTMKFPGSKSIFAISVKDVKVLCVFGTRLPS